jgi:hypothetical protein
MHHIFAEIMQALRESAILRFDQFSGGNPTECVRKILVHLQYALSAWGALSVTAQGLPKVNEVARMIVGTSVSKTQALSFVHRLGAAIELDVNPGTQEYPILTENRPHGEGV